MSGKVIMAMFAIHFAFWIVQISINALTGGEDCGDVGNFACGSVFMRGLSGFAGQGWEINSVLDAGRFAGNVLKSGFNIVVGLAFFDYAWLDTENAGAAVQIVVGVIRAGAGAVVLAILMRGAVGLIRKG